MAEAYQCSACGFLSNDVSLFLQHQCSTNNGMFTAVVMLFFLSCSNYTNFDFRSSVVLFPPFCHFVKSIASLIAQFHESYLLNLHFRLLGNNSYRIS